MRRGPATFASLYRRDERLEREHRAGRHTKHDPGCVRCLDARYRQSSPLSQPSITLSKKEMKA
jgi:hypothetical protein